MPIAILSLTLFVSFILFFQLLNMQNKALESQADEFLKAIAVVLNADRDLYQAKVAEMELVNRIGQYQKADSARIENADQVKDRFNQYRQFLKAYPDVTSQFRGFEPAFNTWLDSSNKLVSAATSGNTNQISSLTATTDRYFDQLRDILDKAGEQAEKKSIAVLTEIESDINQFQFIASIIVLIILAVAGWFSYIVPKNLTDQINFLTRRISEIASGDGDLTAQIAVKSKDEFGDLAKEFNLFVSNLRDLVSTIMAQSKDLEQLTDTLAGTADSSKSITQTLNSASDSIVSAVHEMNLSNKEMSQVATISAEEADSSHQMAIDGIKVVEESNKRINELSSEMERALSSSDELQKSSGDIASVLSVIRGIAEQTNLLALNAAIEAARAGEQGRGFAVVADEVRTLATRTQESTNHIQTMIESLQSNINDSAAAISNGKSNVDKTVEIFQKANEVFESLQASSVRVNEMSTQTAQATEEQTAVSTEISQNLHALSDQTASANSVAQTSNDLSIEIRNLSYNLNNLVGRFKV